MQFLRYAKEEIIADVHNIIRNNFNHIDAETVITTLDVIHNPLKSFCIFEEFGVGGMKFELYSREENSVLKFLRRFRIPYHMIKENTAMAKDIVLENVLEELRIGYMNDVNIFVGEDFIIIDSK